MKNVVKECVYLDILLWGSFYVIKSTFLRENLISGQKQVFKKAAQFIVRHAWLAKASFVVDDIDFEKHA